MHGGRSHLGSSGVCALAAAAAAGVVVAALLPSQSRGLIRALVGGLIAIGWNPTGLRGRTL